MKVILFGATGQLGTALQRQPEPGVEVIPAPRAINLTDGESVSAYLAAASPDWVLNAAAMTDVDGAHLNPQEAFAVNTLGPGWIARACAEVGARMVQVSTEAVFDGEYEGRYTELDPCRPVSVYGASKLAAEHVVRAYSPDSVVIRTSWLYSRRPGANFPSRLLNQLRDTTSPVRVVTDVVGNPTPATVLAIGIVRAMQIGLAGGTYHLCCSGAASKHDWARQIAASAGFAPSRIEATTSDQYVMIASRPRHVDLDTTKLMELGVIDLPDWRDAWLDEWSSNCR